jgi:hypothetical protein
LSAEDWSYLGLDRAPEEKAKDIAGEMSALTTYFYIDMRITLMPVVSESIHWILESLLEIFLMYMTLTRLIFRVLLLNIIRYCIIRHNVITSE